MSLCANIVPDLCLKFLVFTDDFLNSLDNSVSFDSLTRVRLRKISFGI
jgi:hypothetical protein